MNRKNFLLSLGTATLAATILNSEKKRTTPYILEKNGARLWRVGDIGYVVSMKNGVPEFIPIQTCYQEGGKE